ncbi:UNVERIFIED_CONTAM: hypothetical protein HDU68_009401, partial [Siphonaria sp. JEL0065]
MTVGSFERVYCPLPQLGSSDSKDVEERGATPYLHLAVSLNSEQLERGSNASIKIQVINTTGQRIVVRDVALVASQG